MLRALLITMLLGGVAGRAIADESQPAPAPTATMQGGAVPSGSAPGQTSATGDLPAIVKGSTGAPALLPPPGEPPHEYLEYRPSGFWTSNRPAVGGSYRWRLLGIGVVLASLTGVLLLRLVRKANRQREQQL